MVVPVEVTLRIGSDCKAVRLWSPFGHFSNYPRSKRPLLGVTCLSSRFFEFHTFSFAGATGQVHVTTRREF